MVGQRVGNYIKQALLVYNRYGQLILQPQIATLMLDSIAMTSGKPEVLPGPPDGTQPHA